MEPNMVTFTGLDERSDLTLVDALELSYPVEWGVLFSPKLTGQHPRYPGLNTVDTFRDRGCRMAAHLCGGYARRALLLDRVDEILDLTEGFQRIQLNYAPDPEKTPGLRNEHESMGLPYGHWEAIRFAQLSGKQVIVQHRTLTFPTDSRLSYLYDKSGGKGELAAEWPPHPGQRGGEDWYGYAGGLNPENVAAAVRSMNVLGDHWIDMESGVRTDDWLDLSKVRSVLEAVYPD